MIVMGFSAGDSVSTAYGCGFVEEVRDNDYVVRLKCWNLAQGQSPTLYLTEDGITPLRSNAFPGTTVETFCGPATITQIRGTTFVAQPTAWKLAEYSPDIFLYLNADSVKVIDQ